MRLYNGDCIEVLKQLEENSVDAIVTDPPYELGFMGKSWDGTGIANDKEMWADVLRVLKPGGHLLAFSGTRTYHRMAVAIEDAGFEVRDMIEWVYGSGFPKSLNIGKAVDKLQGNKREVVGKTQSAQFQEKGYEYKGKAKGSGFANEKYWGFGNDVTKGTSEWEGWGTALKPAHEPICMARKPLAEKTVAENCLKWGTGGINIDESRIYAPLKVGEKVYMTNQIGKREASIEGFADNGRLILIKFDSGATKVVNKRSVKRIASEKPSVPQPQGGTGDIYGFKNGQGRSGEMSDNSQGRFPANLIHDNSEEVRECFPDSKSPAKRQTNSWYPTGEANGVDGEAEGYGDSGNASRFFKSIIYQAKASKSERNKGCEELEQQITSDGREKSIDNAFQRGETLRHNNHPTVKPIALMSYLIKMVTPKGGTVLDPFMGSGSTGVAAKQNGYDFIGIEREADYIKIAEARINAIPDTLI